MPPESAKLEDMSDLPPPQFRKTKTGKWAVMGPVETLEAALANSSGVVEVQRKSGDWSKFTVASLGRAFDVDGVQMCYGYAPDDESEPDRARPATGGQATQAARPQQRRAPQATPPPPPRDESEPLPEYQGGPEDEWHPDHGGF